MMRVFLRIAAVLAICLVATWCRADQAADGSLTVAYRDSDSVAQSYTFLGTVTTNDNGNYKSFSTTDTTAITDAVSGMGWAVSYEDPSNAGYYWGLTGVYAVNSLGATTGTPLVNMGYAAAPFDEPPPIPGDTPPTTQPPSDPTSPVLPANVGLLTITSSAGSYSVAGNFSENGSEPYVAVTHGETIDVDSDAVWQVYTWNDSYQTYFVYSGTFGGDGFLGGSFDFSGSPCMVPGGFTTASRPPSSPTPGGSPVSLDIPVSIPTTSSGVGPYMDLD